VTQWLDASEPPAWQAAGAGAGPAAAAAGAQAAPSTIAGPVVGGLFAAGVLVAAAAFFGSQLRAPGKRHARVGRSPMHHAGSVGEVVGAGGSNSPVVVENPTKTRPSKETEIKETDKGVWRQYTEAKTGDTWFVHSETAETVWHLPPGEVAAEAITV